MAAPSVAEGRIRFYKDLGWGAAMLAHLDGLAAVLEGRPAEAMRALLGPLARHRQAWRDAPASIWEHFALGQLRRVTVAYAPRGDFAVIRHGPM